MQLNTTQKFFSYFKLFFTLCIGTTAVFTFLGFFGQYNWGLDLLSHFREYYIILCITFLIIGVCLKLRFLSISILIILLINIAQFVQFLPSLHHDEKTNDDVIVFMANVKTDNHQYDRLVDYLEQVDPDIFILEEADDQWVNAIQTLRTKYIYSIAEARDDNFGIILASKIPLQNARIEKIGAAGRPTVVTTIGSGENQLTLIGTHPFPPFTQRMSDLRNNQLEKIEKLVNDQKLPVLLVGDLNSTPFSYPYRHLIQQTKMIDCANGFGYQGTWKHSTFLPPLRLSLDHCLRTPTLSIKDITVGQDIGSDHLPIVVRVGVKKGH